MIDFTLFIISIVLYVICVILFIVLALIFLPILMAYEYVLKLISKVKIKRVDNLEKKVFEEIENLN
jgi:hypothetical protein